MVSRCYGLLTFSLLHLTLGADVIAFPTNWMSSRISWRTRARENGVYFVGANRWGVERGVHFCGRSCVYDPLGKHLHGLASTDKVFFFWRFLSNLLNRRDISTAR